MSVWAGIDPGERRLGLARGDPLGSLATARAIAGDREELLVTLREWHEEYELAGVVVGLPRDMRGTYGPIARRSLVLAEWLRESLEVPVRLWDERLSSRRAAAGSRGGPIDDRAAAEILQSSLDSGTPDVEDPPELCGP